MYRSKQCFSVSQSINQSANQHTNNVTPGLKKLHRLPIQYKIKFKICLMMHSVSVNHCPTYISQLVQPVSSSSRRQGVRSSSSAKCVVQRTRTKFAERAFSVAGPSVWNSLPADLRLEPETTVFKRKPKSYLFRSVLTQ